MSGITNHERKISASDTPGEDEWVDIDLQPRNLDLDPHRPPKAPVFGGHIAGFTDLLDLEARAPSTKNRFWRHGTVSKVVVGVALVAMLLAAVIVPVAVVIVNRESRERR